MVDTEVARRMAVAAVEAVKDDAKGDTFSGDAEKYPVWKHATRIHLEYSDLDEAGKVKYTMQRIRGDATLNFDMDQKATTVAAIWTKLDAVYGLQMTQRDASYQLDNLYQGKDTLPEYTNKFNRLAAILGMVDSTRIGRHSAHVAKHLRKEAALISTDTYTTYLRTLTRVDEATKWDREKESRRDSKATVKGEDKPRDKKGKWKARGAQEEEVECYHCHKKGHMKKDCRSFKAEKAKQAKEKKKGSRDTPEASVDGEESEND